MRHSWWPSSNWITPHQPPEQPIPAIAPDPLEGYENNADTRKEVWVPVSRINATEGARPIAGAELTLQSGGKQQTIKSNHVGQFHPCRTQTAPSKSCTRMRTAS